MAELILHTPQLSTYARICAIVAAECSVPVRSVTLVPRSPENFDKHPSGRTSSAEIDGHAFYETAAICRYLDEAHNEARLQGVGPEQKARNDQWISIANAYVFPVTEHGLVLPRLAIPMMGGQLQEEVIKASLPKVNYTLKVLSDRLEASRCFGADAPLMCDFFLYPMLRAVQLTPEGEHLIEQYLPLRHWIERIGERPSTIATRWPGED